MLSETVQRPAMAARLFCAASLLLLLAASGGAALSHPVSRRLLHAGHSDAASGGDTAGSDTSYIEGSNSSTTAVIQQLKQSLTGSSGNGDLSEDDVNTLLQDVQGYACNARFSSWKACLHGAC